MALRFIVEFESGKGSRESVRKSFRKLTPYECRNGEQLGAAHTDDDFRSKKRAESDIPCQFISFVCDLYERDTNNKGAHQ